MACGLGKTATVAFESRIRLREDPGTRILYLCDQGDILLQAQQTFVDIVGEDIRYGFLTGQQKHLNAQITFGTFQTLIKFVKHLPPDFFDIVIIDEGHHVEADTFKYVADALDPKFLIGITATPERGDARDITDTFGPPVFELGLAEALAKKYLSPVDYRLHLDELNIDEELKERGRRFHPGSINKTVFLPKRDDAILEIIRREIAEVANPKMIMFCASIEHAERMSSLMEGSLCIHSGMSSTDRTTRLNLFRLGIVHTLIGVDYLNEGVDVPDANVIVFLRSTSSERIFLQQLGRGLRLFEGKTKVIVLDFAANFNRIGFVQKLREDVREQGRQTYPGEALVPIEIHIEPKQFGRMEVDIESVLNRIAVGFYSFEEAKHRVLEMGIANCEEYRRDYWYDIRLPSSPHQVYHNEWAGWPNFFGRECRLYPRIKIDCYETVGEASTAAIALGIANAKDYQVRYKEDSGLPAAPEKRYADFPGYPEFLGQTRYHRNEFYQTWRDAAEAAKELGVLSRREYSQKYRSDPKLPSRPYDVYSDFPGWGEFLGTGKEMRAGDGVYPTMNEASAAAKSLGFMKEREYKDGYKVDPRLPSSPERKYQDFPGWPDFLGTVGTITRKSVFGRKNAPMYSTWQEASEAAQKLAICNCKEYRRGAYKSDPKLTSSPHTRYPDFPGWKTFLGQE
jgi:hypothetical protein